MKFIYIGQVKIEKDSLANFLDVGRELEIKGLSD